MIDTWSTNMRSMIPAAAVTLFAASTAQAQEAVQWKVSDGGNGHWYHCLPLNPPRNVSDAQSLAQGAGGNLASLCGTEFDAVVAKTGALNPSNWMVSPANGGHLLGPWLGMKIVGTTISWIDASSCVFDRWDVALHQPDLAGEDAVMLYSTNSMPNALCHDVAGTRQAQSMIVEWSADCNNDGIVDYGQCRDGSLPDYNGNNIPDCCESGTPCVVGNYPVQWRVEDGGNGHWYQSEGSNGLTFEQARAIASGSGGWVVMPKTLSAVNFVFSRLVNDPALWWSPSGIPRHGPWIGLVQDPKSPEYSEPGGGWRWMDGSVASYFNWAEDPCQPQPANCFCGTSTCGLNNAGFYTGGLGAPVTSAGWGAFAADMSGAVGGLIIEWSADCNGDGVVDYGQILQGQLADVNQNGIPDICQQPTCVDADFFRDFTVNGADLGILLSQWGATTPLTVSDLNSDGTVDGVDLGLFLSFWGTCP